MNNSFLSFNGYTIIQEILKDYGFILATRVVNFTSTQKYPIPDDWIHISSGSNIYWIQWNIWKCFDIIKLSWELRDPLDNKNIHIL